MADPIVRSAEEPPLLQAFNRFRDIPEALSTDGALLTMHIPSACALPLAASRAPAGIRVLGLVWLVGCHAPCVCSESPSSSTQAAGGSAPAEDERTPIEPTPASLATPEQVSGFVGHLPSLELPAAVDLDGDEKPEQVVRQADGSWRIGSHAFSGCRSCQTAHLVNLSRDDPARELLLFGVPGEEMNEVVFVRYEAHGLHTRRWETSDGEVSISPLGRIIVDKCGEAREVYALWNGTLRLERRLVYELVPGGCPG